MARSNPAGTYRRVAALFTVAFLVVLIVLALLGHFGLPEAFLGVILGGALLVTFALIGLNAGTMEMSEFHLAGRSVSAAANGMASAAAVIGGALFLGLAGAFFADPWTGAAMTAGWSLGCVVLAVGIAPYFRKSGAFGAADFLGIRYGGRLTRLAAAAVIVPALLAALGATLAAGAFVAGGFFDIGPGPALAIVCAVVATTTLLGGMRAITLAAIIQYIVLAVAILLPVGIVSAREFLMPLPHFTFGLGFDRALLLAEATGTAMAPPLSGIFSAVAPAGGAGLIAIVVSLAAGVAVLPHLVVRSATVTTVAETRRSAGWTLFFILVVALAAPAFATFAELVVMRDLAGTPLEQLPDWVFSFGSQGWVTICGIDAISPVAVINACRTEPGFTGNLAVDDFAMSGDALVLGGSAIFELPYVSTALVTSGALAAIIAAASAIAFTLASALGHDLYGGVIAARVSAGRQLIITRIILAGVILLGAWLAAFSGAAMLRLTLAAIGLSAGGLFPAMILGVWWRRANSTGALAGVAGGGLVTLAVTLEAVFPGTLPLAGLNPAHAGLTELTAAIAGMPIGFVVAIAVSLATRAPTPERDALVDAIRRPGGTPFVQESESR